MRLPETITTARPAYNNSRDIRESLLSCLKQAHPNKQNEII
jgi:hypothetical protein